VNVAILGIKSIPAQAGADRVVERLLEHRSPEHEYWIYIRKDTESGATCHDNLHFIHVPALRGKHLGAFVYFLLCTAHCLLKRRYDVAHVHNSDFGLFVPLLRLKPGLRVLGTFHGDPYTRQKWGPLARFYLRCSERVFVSASHRLSSVSRFKDQAPGLFGRRSVLYIPNGVDAVDFSKPPQQPFPYAQYGLVPGNYVLFAAGRLDRTKGLHLLLAAYRQLPQAPRLLAVGDFAHDAAYSAQIQAQAAEDERVVLYPSLLARDTLLDVVHRCAVFVFPSLYEAMSMMLLEAIACGPRIVASNIDANLELLGADYEFAYPAEDADALAASLGAALAAPAGSPALWQRTRERHSWPRIAKAYEAQYAALRGAAPASAVSGSTVS
jgi:glycosyltransferase involved in cell wall biosynthesis